jgi:hypothetical protein
VSLAINELHQKFSNQQRGIPRMARPTKQGIDYFPLDCTLDEKTEPYVIENGAIGWAVMTTLWAIIYRTEGYYAKDAKPLWLMVKKQLNDVDINKVNECINSMIDHNIFDKVLHKKYGILTSGGVQKRFLFIASRRKHVQVIQDFLLVNGVIDYRNLELVHLNPVNVDIVLAKTPHSKVKEKESIEKESIGISLPIQEKIKNSAIKKSSDKRTPKTPWPEDFQLTIHLTDYAQKQGVPDPVEEFENFRLNALAKSYVYADWSSAWMKWCRDERTNKKPKDTDGGYG